MDGSWVAGLSHLQHLRLFSFYGVTLGPACGSLTSLRSLEMACGTTGTARTLASTS